MRRVMVLGVSCLLGWNAMAALGQEADPQPYSHTAEYRSMLDELHQPAPSPAFIATGKRPAADPALHVQVDETAQRLHLETAAAEFSLDKTTGILTWTNRKTHAAWAISSSAECKPANAVSAARQGNVWSFAACDGTKLQLELMTRDLARITADAPGEVQLHVDGSSALFGLGERFWQAGLGGTQLDVRPQDRYGEPGHHWVYVAIPFVYGTDGNGLYADTAFDTRFAFNPAGTSFDVKIASHPVPIYLFSASSPKSVLTAYTGITGRPEMPPLWAFGPWITALGGKGDVLNVAHRLRTEGVPASALWVFDELDNADNLGWPFWFGSYYGDARAFSDLLHGQGFKILTYVHPYVRSQVLPYNLPNPVFEKGVADHLLAVGADGKPAGPKFELVPDGNVDFTNPAAVDWWDHMITAAVRDEHLDGWMEDFGEWVRDTDKFSAGDGRTISELYPLLYHKVTLRAAQRWNPDVAPFSRSGSPGSQAFSPVLWGADQWPDTSRDYGLPSVVTAGITAGMSGYSTWGPDILSSGSSKELWIRWVEFGALTPVMRDHTWNKPEHSINLFTDADATSIFRRYAQLHSSLLPYFATYADEAHRTGIPIMRHTVLEAPDDPRSAGAEYQYFLGKELLVAPVVDGSSLRKLYLPRGEWVNFWNGGLLYGGQDVSVPAGLGEIPILVRAGSVLPFKPEAEAASWDWSDPNLLKSSLVWKVYLSVTGVSEGHFTLPNGTSAHLVQADNRATVDGRSATARDYEIVMRSVQPPTQVLLDGKPLAPYTPPATGGKATQWWWNPATFDVHVVFHAANFHLEMAGVRTEQYQN